MSETVSSIIVLPDRGIAYLGDGKVGVVSTIHEPTQQPTLLLTKINQAKIGEKFNDPIQLPALELRFSNEASVDVVIKALRSVKQTFKKRNPTNQAGSETNTPH